jgi:hypothetical protein
MEPALRKFGVMQTPVVVVDNICGDLAPVIATAAALAPFPPATNYYPGLRRVIHSQDSAYGYVEHLLERAAPFIGGAYDIDRFELIEASFSLVTCPPERLIAPQRSPHFDSTDDNYFAVMHYLCETEGTAFYQHRATGIERIRDINLNSFVETAKAENARASAEYIIDSNEYYERIGAAAGRLDRLLIYPGNLLHSGIIGSDNRLSSDPRNGRLTTNIFIRASGG